MDESDKNKKYILEATTKIVSSYVSNPTFSASKNDLEAFIKNIYECLNDLYEQNTQEKIVIPKPIVPINETIQDNFIICLEDGERFKSLKRHLRVQYNMSPEDYRKKWNLPHDYPMVPPNYAKQRSKLAKEIGLGKKVKTSIS